MSTDPLADLLRKTAAGDKDAEAAFWRERAVRVRARRELHREGHKRARAMITRRRTS